MAELRTSRLVLRRPTPADYSVARKFYQSERSRYAGGGDGTTDAQAFVIFAAMMGHWDIRGFGTFVATRQDTGAVVGGFGPHFPDSWPEHELGWCIWDPTEERLGFASEATATLRAYARRELGWKTMVSYIHPDNAQSVRLAENLGCRLDPDAQVPAGKASPPLVYRHPSE